MTVRKEKAPAATGAKGYKPRIRRPWNDYKPTGEAWQIPSITYEEAATRWRAMNGDQDAEARVQLMDLEGLHNADTFLGFLTLNAGQNFELLEGLE